jgi:hypothetical protein
MPITVGLSLSICFFPLTFSWTGWYKYYRFWDGLFFLQPFHGRVGFEITGFGTGCNFFCLSIRGFWTWTGKNFVKKQAFVKSENRRYNKPLPYK